MPRTSLSHFEPISASRLANEVSSPLIDLSIVYDQQS